MSVNAVNASNWVPDELESPVTCPACDGALGGSVYEELHDGLEQVPGLWRLRRCMSCASLVLDPRPTLAAVGKAYKSYYTHANDGDSGDGDGSVLWKLARGYLNHRYGSQRTPAWPVGRVLLPLLWPLRQQLDYFQRHLPGRPGRLLDVGCGNGAFMRRARLAGWQATGIEPDADAVIAARSGGLKVHAGTLEDFPADEGAFDAVTASHVIEHVHKPLAFLDRVRELLKPDGMLWLATPNIDSLGHRYYGRFWRGLEPPRHMVIFSRYALKTLLERTGFVDIRFHKRGRGSRYILDTSRALARTEGMQLIRLPPWCVDVLASTSANAGEELVATARKAG